ncbi:hypothetical protein [Hymenobacter gelipurpurascens]|nr:hypothetical protein [Hymenobacter gelipurpurascens]
MLSTQNYSALPNRETMQRVCKAVAALDAMLSPEWEYRYHTYNAEWAEGEEVFEMNDGEGDQMLVLFRPEGCVINGFGLGCEEIDKEQLTDDLPPHFHEFIFGEPVASIGTTFCLWTSESGEWQISQNAVAEDASEEMLNVLDGNPQTYQEWAEEYFESEALPAKGISPEAIAQVYQGQPLTRELVERISRQVTDWEQLREDLTEIKYPFSF